MIKFVKWIKKKWGLKNVAFNVPNGKKLIIEFGIIIDDGI